MLRVSPPGYRARIGKRSRFGRTCTSDGQVFPAVFRAKPLDQLVSRSSEQRGDRVRVVAVGDAVGPHKTPQPHERADCRIHRQKVVVDDRRDLSADMDFSASAKIGAHDRADEMERKTPLDLSPRLDPHCPQIRLAEAGLAIKFIKAGIVETKARRTAAPRRRSIPMSSEHRAGRSEHSLASTAPPCSSDSSFGVGTLSRSDRDASECDLLVSAAARVLTSTK